jgi:hypothetical protein
MLFNAVPRLESLDISCSNTSDPLAQLLSLKQPNIKTLYLN